MAPFLFKQHLLKILPHFSPLSQQKIRKRQNFNKKGTSKP